MSSLSEPKDLESQRAELERFIQQQTNPELLEEIKLVVALTEEPAAAFDYAVSYVGTTDAHARGN